MTPTTEPADVVVIGPSHLDSFASNIADGFDDLGVRARVLDPFASFAGTGTLRAYGRYGKVMRRIVDESTIARTTLIDRPLAHAIEQFDPRLVLSVYGYFDPVQVERWRRTTPNATWALWYPDHLANLGPHRTLLAPYDHFFFKDPYIVELFSRRADLPAHYLADACNPRHHRPREDGADPDSEVCDVVFVGNLYPYRMLILESLATNIDLRIYGNQHRPLPPRFSRFTNSHAGKVVLGSEKARVFANARIVLNTMHYGEVSGVNARLFEATGSGGFVITHGGQAVSRYFEPGREVAVFDTPKEMNGAIKRYLADPEARQAIATAGSTRAHRDHTYPARIKELVRACDLDVERPFAAMYGVG